MLIDKENYEVLPYEQDRSQVNLLDAESYSYFYLCINGKFVAEFSGNTTWNTIVNISYDEIASVEVHGFTTALTYNQRNIINEDKYEYPLIEWPFVENADYYDIYYHFENETEDDWKFFIRKETTSDLIQRYEWPLPLDCVDQKWVIFKVEAHSNRGISSTQITQYQRCYGYKQSSVQGVSVSANSDLTYDLILE